MIKVKNINNTSDNKCFCSSWLDHWKKFSNQALPSFCSEVNCRKSPEVGAHVQKDVSSDNAWYIIPLCKDCNGRKGESIYVMNGTSFVSANVSETCGKSR